MSRGDLGVDVLIIGSGLLAHYLADALHPRYSVCLVDDPGYGNETLDGTGYISAGYDGNDVARIQPARRAASFWRSWLALEPSTPPGDDPWWVGPGSAVVERTRLWSEATLPTTEAAELPAALGGGALAGHVGYRLLDDTVMHPAAALARLRAPLADRIVRASVTRFGMFTDDVIETVEVEVDGVPQPIVARYVVFAADAGNAELCNRLASRFSDSTRRKEAKAAVRSSQAVRQVTTVAVRGDLPVLSGSFGDLVLVSHRRRDQVIWLATSPVDDRATTLGPVDFRFIPQPDRASVRSLVGALESGFAGVADALRTAEWAAYTRRETVHPTAAGAGPDDVGRPVPARLDTFGVEGLLVLWPSHLGHSMIVGDVAAERIADALGTPADFSGGPQPADLATEVGEPVARWDGGDLVWGTRAELDDRFGLQRPGAT